MSRTGGEVKVSLRCPSALLKRGVFAVFSRKTRREMGEMGEK